MFNSFFYPYLYDPVVGRMPREYFLKPPTLYSIMEAMANFENENKVKVVDLAGATREKIFNFNYPLSENINKEYFEKMILNHFIERRINYETFTMFQIKLNVKLNEIMPKYNMLFNAMDGWDLFTDGGNITRTSTDNRNTRSETDTTDSSQQQAATKLTDDKRFSNIPENQISQVKSGEYLTTYNYDQSDNNSSSNASGTSHGEGKTFDVNIHTDEEKRSITNRVDEFIKSAEVQNVFTMIFNELDCLFYQIVF